MLFRKSSTFIIANKGQEPFEFCVTIGTLLLPFHLIHFKWYSWDKLFADTFVGDKFVWDVLLSLFEELSPIFNDFNFESGCDLTEFKVHLSPSYKWQKIKIHIFQKQKFKVYLWRNQQLLFFVYKFRIITLAKRGFWRL